MPLRALGLFFAVALCACRTEGRTDPAAVRQVIDSLNAKLEGWYAAGQVDSVANVFADAPSRYPEVTLEQARERRPDVVLAPSEPYPFKQRHVAQLEAVAPVRLVDGQDLFWWGARTPAAIDRLHRHLHNR